MKNDEVANFPRATWLAIAAGVGLYTVLTLFREKSSGRLSPFFVVGLVLAMTTTLIGTWRRWMWPCNGAPT